MDEASKIKQQIVNLYTEGYGLEKIQKIVHKRNNFISDTINDIGIKRERVVGLKLSKRFYSLKNVGKRMIDHRGHIRILVPQGINKNKYIVEHRLIMKKKMGRELTSQEVVHHIDCDKLNNNPNNLWLYENNSQHHLSHWNLNRDLYKLIPIFLKIGIIKFEDGHYFLNEVKNGK